MSEADVVDPVLELRTAVGDAAAAIRGDGGERVAVGLERPKRAGQGDYASNAAMLLAPRLGAPPREIAGQIGEALASALGNALVRYEVAGPGFLNLVLSDDWHRDAVRGVLAAGASFGGGGGGPGAERIVLEFVSANPTAELVAASGRHAAYGDSLARILQHHGHAVSREYYFNDAGGQIRRFGESIQARANGLEPPQDGYQGEYIAALAAEIPDAGTRGVDEVARDGVDILLARIKATLVRYGVAFDTYFSERTLHEGGSESSVARSIARVRDAGHVYESEGATWLRTTTFGDDKDRVLLRSGGEPTYFAADVAYMENKLERGFERQLLPVGSDHHGYVARLKAAFEALGHDPAKLEPLIIQFVHLVEGSERAAMSKRRGEFVTLDELLDEIGVDATRYFMLRSSHDRTLDLDLDLARSQSRENPVYYIQYAHARIHSVLAKLGESRVDSAVTAGADWGTTELHPSERELIKKLLALPEEVRDAAADRAPHRIAGYALELAQEFTAFYRDCHVVGADGDGVESFRVGLCVASQGALALVLGLLGVSAPDTM